MKQAAVRHVPIGDVVVKASTWNPSRDAADSEIAYIDLSAIDNVTKTINGFQSMAGRDAPSRARQLVQVGDLLVSTVRPNLNGVARVPNHLDGGTASTGFCVLRPSADKIDASFLFHWIQSPNFVDDMIKKATGASYPAVSDKIILQSEIPLPPLDEQKRIAAILDQADELRRKRQRALDRLNQLGQAIFIEMFGDPLGSSSKLPVVDFSDVVRRITYGFTSPMSHMDSGVPIITAKNVRDGWIDLEKVHYADQLEFDALTSKSKPEKGDILITKDGTIGRCAIVGEAPQLCINQSVALIQPRHDLVSSTYLLAYLMTPRVQKTFKGMKKGNAIAHLQITELARLPIPTPSLLDQAKFEARIIAAAAAKQGLERCVSMSNDLFTSLQHRAFEGEL